MQTYRWPGYAVFDGELFETMTPQPGDPGQRWRKVERVHRSALLALAAQLEQGVTRRFADMPRDGVVDGAEGSG